MSGYLIKSCWPCLRDEITLTETLCKFLYMQTNENWYHGTSLSFSRCIPGCKNQTRKTHQKHFNIFIIKIFTYKMAYKHYLQHSEQWCLLRHGQRYLYTENTVHHCQKKRWIFAVRRNFPSSLSRGRYKEKIGTLQLFPWGTNLQLNHK